MVMTPLELIAQKKAQASRFANESGAVGEQRAVVAMERWVPRPKGRGLQLLLKELAATGVLIKGSSFDALALPVPIDVTNSDQLRAHLNEIVFIEIKSSNQSRVRPGFNGFFFALTESEISAAEQLGGRHRVALFNAITGEMLMTSVPEILSRAKSTNWQVSVQL